MVKRLGLWLLKLIGVGLFIVILLQIDRTAVLAELKAVNLELLGTAFIAIFFIYFCKTKRFKELTTQAGLQMPLKKHWEIFNIGIFLAAITPGKIGELSRAAYLKTSGLEMAAAVAVTILDRIIDAIFICIIATGAIGILFGWQWAGALVALILAGVLIARLLFKKIAFIQKYIRFDSVAPVAIWTVAAWSCYFVSTIMIGRAIGIDVPISVLISVLTVSGILSLLPIAPSGLGTRDATFIVLLAPYGVSSEQAVAYALLMFLSIILSSFLGGWYFVKGVR